MKILTQRGQAIQKLYNRGAASRKKHIEEKVRRIIEHIRLQGDDAGVAAGIGSLAAAIRRMGDEHITPTGLCRASNFLLQGDGVVFRRTRWREVPDDSPQTIISRIIRHDNVRAALQGVLESPDDWSTFNHTLFGKQGG